MNGRGFGRANVAIIDANAVRPIIDKLLRG